MGAPHGLKKLACLLTPILTTTLRRKPIPQRMFMVVMASSLNMVSSQLNMAMGLNMVQIVDNITLIIINSMDIHRSLVDILVIANIHHPHQTSRQAKATNSH